jgi:glycine/D-amino acid oxidase-like deaminating enzyme/nitrite reductase/ring-hydroxylating ferredoxin subunit
LGSERIPYDGPLIENLRTQVAIVGAGITGLTTALQLARSGIQSLILEKYEVGSGATGQSSAHLSSFWDGSYADVIEKYGVPTGVELYRAMNKGISFIQAHSPNDAGFARLPGYYFLSRDTEGRDRMEKERQALEKMRVPHRCTKEPLFGQIAIRIDRQGMFNPVAYLQGLAELYRAAGGRIFTHTSVDDFEGTLLKTPRGEVKADAVVWATHTPLGLNPVMQSLVSPKRSFISIYKVRKSLPLALFWDTASPYRYLRPYQDDMIIVGGEDVATGEPHADQNSYESLEEYLSPLGIESELSSWSAQFFEPLDHLPLIGEDPLHSHHYLATGLSGDGLALGSFAGQALAGLITADPKWKRRLHEFRPLRLKTFFSGDYYSHNLKVARHLVGDRLKPTGLNLEVNLRRGEGAVVDNGGEKLALYRNARGEMHMYSAICPHMKAVLIWNEEEKTFDCPCHGSRFNCEGEVVEGPSLHNLKPINPPIPVEPASQPLLGPLVNPRPEPNVLPELT